MIDTEKHGIEAGDRIRITIEGVVKLNEDSFSRPTLAIDGVGLYPWPGLTWTVEPIVEILEKADPAWWSAKVIRARYLKYGHRAELDYYIAANRAEGPTFIDADGGHFAPEELGGVEVVVP